MAEDRPPEYFDPGFNQGGAPAPGPSLWQQAQSYLKGFGEIGVPSYLSIAGTMMSFVGQLQAASAAKRAASYNAKVAEMNAQAAADAAEVEAQQHQRNAAIATQDIFLSRQAQQWREDQQRQQQEYVAGQTEAIIGASGLRMSGSPLAAYEYTLQQQERTILAGQYQQRLQERALQDKAVTEGYAADVSRAGAGERLRVGKAQALGAEFEGSQRAYAGTLGAVGSLISGGAKTYALMEKAKARKKGVSLLANYMED